MRESLGEEEDHPLVALTLYHLGDVAEKRGLFKEAERLYQSSLSMDKRLHRDADHSDIVTTLQKLADVTLEIGDLSKAEKLSRESIGMRKRLKGDSFDHSDASVVIYEIGQKALEVYELDSRRTFVSGEPQFSFPLSW